LRNSTSGPLATLSTNNKQEIIRYRREFARARAILIWLDHLPDESSNENLFALSMRGLRAGGFSPKETIFSQPKVKPDSETTSYCAIKKICLTRRNALRSRDSPRDASIRGI